MKFILLGLSAFIVLIFYIICFPFRFYVHPVLNIITHGVSGGKVYFFLVYSIISFLLLSLFKTKAKPTELDKKYRWYTRLFIFFVFTGMASSIGSFLYYIFKFDLPLEAYHYHFKDIYNSVNFFPHIHTSKLYLFVAAKILGIEHLFRGMDDGRVFQGSIPVFFPFVTLVSIIMVIFLSFFLIRKMVSGWEERYRSGISLISIISLSSVIKTMSDGGPFSYDFLVAICVIYIIASSKKPEDIFPFIKKRWRFLFWGLFSVLTLMSLIDPSFTILTYTVKNGFSLLMVYFAIYFLTIRDKVRKRLQLFVLICLTVFFSYAVHNRYNTYIKPFQIYLEKGTQVNYFYYKDRPLPESLKNATPVFDLDFLTIYAFKTEKRIKPIDIYRQLSENPFRNRHIAIITPKKRQAYGIVADVLFIDFQNKKTLLKVPRIVDIRLTRKDSHKERFDIQIAYDTTYFPALSHVEEGRITQLDENHKFLMYYFLNRFFLHYGINEYILTPVAFYRFN